MLRGNEKYTTKGQRKWKDKFITGLANYIAAKCPTCDKLAKPIKNNPGWYYCHNPSCNMTVFQKRI